MDTWKSVLIGASSAALVLVVNYYCSIAVPTGSTENNIATDNKSSNLSDTNKDLSQESVEKQNEVDEDLFADEKYKIQERNIGFTDVACKMVLCVNAELQMGKGKMCAQCGHATLGAYKLACKYSPQYLKIWEYFGQAKIAVKVDTEDALFELYDKAKAKGIVAYLVADAGKTQIAAGSRTVLALGPAPSHLFEGLTDKLKLL
jgi:PTH2 family peptidyl-tRNA hydrolase